MSTAEAREAISNADTWLRENDTRKPTDEQFDEGIIMGIERAFTAISPAGGRPPR